MKFLLVAVVVIVVLWLMLGRGRRGAPRDGAGAAPPEASQEEMVRCAHCGVHLPRSEAQLAQGRLYCSDAHRVAGPAPADRR